MATGMTAFEQEMASVRDGLVEMASLVLTQIERSVAAWERTDGALAAEVISADDEVDDACIALDERIFNVQLLNSPVAGDQRLLHVGLIAAIALERVGDLAVAISQLAGSVPVGGAVPEVEARIQKMSARAIDMLARAVQAIARGDVELADSVRSDAQRVAELLEELLGVVARKQEDPASREWAAAAVLVGRHLERVSNNARELAGRVPFLIDGQSFRRSR